MPSEGRHLIFRGSRREYGLTGYQMANSYLVEKSIYRLYNGQEAFKTICFLKRQRNNLQSQLLQSKCSNNGEIESLRVQ